MHVHCNESFDPAELRRMAELLVKELGVVPSGYEVRSPSSLLESELIESAPVRCECELFRPALLDALTKGQVLLSVDASHSSGIPSPRYKISGTSVESLRPLTRPDFISPASLKEALSRAN